MNRRNFLQHTSLTALSAVVAQGLHSQVANAKSFDEVVRIGYLPITDATALLIAYQQGFFKEEGLDAAKPTLIRGWSPLVESFVAHKFNLVHLLKPIPIWMRFANNIPVKIVAWAHTNGSALLVGKHTNVTTVEQLGGKTLAVPYWYSIHNIIIQKMLRNAGLKPVIKNQNEQLYDNEVNLQILPPPEMPLALLAKKIDGYIVAEPFNALGELKAGAKVLRFTGDIWKNHPCCVITMHEPVLNTQQEWSQKVVNAIVKAEIFASENKKEVARILSKEDSGLLPFSSKIIERAITHYHHEEEYTKSGAIQNEKEWGNGRIDFQPYPYHSATRVIIEAMSETLVEGNTAFLKKLNPSIAAKEIVDERYVINALRQNPNWTNDKSVTNKENPFQREEIFKL